MYGFGYYGQVSAPPVVDYGKQTNEFLIDYVKQYKKILMDLRAKSINAKLTQKERDEAKKTYDSWIVTRWKPSTGALVNRGYTVRVINNELIIKPPESKKTAPAPAPVRAAPAPAPVRAAPAPAPVKAAPVRAAPAPAPVRVAPAPAPVRAAPAPVLAPSTSLAPAEVVESAKPNMKMIALILGGVAVAIAVYMMKKKKLATA